MIWGWKWIETNLKIPNQESWPQGIIQSKEETTVHKDSNTSNVEATIKSSNTIRCICLPVNINKTIELPFSTLLYIISQTSSGIVEAVDKQKGWGTSSTSWGQVAKKPFPVTILILVEIEKPIEVAVQMKLQDLACRIQIPKLAPTFNKPTELEIAQLKMKRF